MVDDEVTRYLAPHGVLRASINLGNPVLAQGTADNPRGVTVELAHEVAARLGVEVRFSCFDAARLSFEATVTGHTELCFLAIEPARQSEITFTAPYALIEGAFAVRRDSSIVTLAQVDRADVRVGVNEGSAYDLYLSRTLRQATVVRGPSGMEAFRTGRLEVVAGIRGPISQLVADNSDLRLLDESFMQIRQALGTRRDAPIAAGRFLHDLVEELKASGFIAAALQRSGQTSVTVARPAGLD